MFSARKGAVAKAADVSAATVAAAAFANSTSVDKVTLPPLPLAGKPNGAMATTTTTTTVNGNAARVGNGNGNHAHAPMPAQRFAAQAPQSTQPPPSTRNPPNGAVTAARRSTSGNTARVAANGHAGVVNPLAPRVTSGDAHAHAHAAAAAPHYRSPQVTPGVASITPRPVSGMQPPPQQQQRQLHNGSHSQSDTSRQSTGTVRPMLSVAPMRPASSVLSGSAAPSGLELKINGRVVRLRPVARGPQPLSVEPTRLPNGKRVVPDDGKSASSAAGAKTKDDDGAKAKLKDRTRSMRNISQRKKIRLTEGADTSWVHGLTDSQWVDSPRWPSSTDHYTRMPRKKKQQEQNTNKVADTAKRRQARRARGKKKDADSSGPSLLKRICRFFLL